MALRITPQRRASHAPRLHDRYSRIADQELFVRLTSMDNHPGALAPSMGNSAGSTRSLFRFETGPCGFMPRRQCDRRSLRPQAQDLDFLNGDLSFPEATTTAPVAA